MKNQWFISIKKNEGDVFDLSNLKHNYPPEGYYWADPFLWQHNGVDYIFYELYDYKKGVIAYSIINEDMTFTEPTVVLECPYHISYPYLFEHKGEILMIPETGLGHVYRCTSFPNKWEFDFVLRDTDDRPIFKKSAFAHEVKDVGDINIIHHNKKYWMYTTVQPQLKHCLAVACSDSIRGPWEIIIDGSQQILNSRSGGKMWISDNIMYRSCQIGKGGYGSGIQIKSIDLDLENGYYNEDIVHEIRPKWHSDIIGTHHFDFNDDLIVLDGKRKINS